MATDVAGTLRKALSKLSVERQRIEKQIAAVEGALRSVDGGPTLHERGGALTYQFDGHRVGAFSSDGT